MSELRQMRTFVEVANRCSFVAAAEVLGTSASSVSRQVTELERDLGVRLLNRSTRRVALTEAGRVYYARCKGILDDVANARAEVRADQREIAGFLRVHAPVSFGVNCLGDHLPGFARAYPQVELHLTLADTPPDLITGGQDIVILPTREGFDASVAARLLARVSVILCAAPEYVRRRGQPEKPEALVDHDFIDVSMDLAQGNWRLRGPDGERDVAPLRQAQLRTNNVELLLRLVRQGFGIAPLPDYIAGDLVDQGALVRVLPEWSFPELTFYAALPSNRLNQPKVRAFLEYVAASMAATDRHLASTAQPERHL